MGARSEPSVGEAPVGTPVLALDRGPRLVQQIDARRRPLLAFSRHQHQLEARTHRPADRTVEHRPAACRALRADGAGRMSARLPGAFLWTLLLLPLTLSPLVGLLTSYVALPVILPLFVMTLVRAGRWSAWSAYDARAFLVVFVALAILFAITADSISDVLRAFNFTMLLAYGPIAMFLEQRPARDPVRLTAMLASAGVVVGFVEVVAGLLLNHEARPA